MNSFNWCPDCGSKVSLGSNFCPSCRFPFTVEAEQKLKQLKSKPKPIEVEEEDEEDETEEISQAQETSVATIEEIGGLEIEGVTDLRVRRESFESIYRSPKQGAISRPREKVDKKQFLKTWKAEAGSSRKNTE